MVYKLYIATGCFLRGFPFALVMSEPLDHCMECADVQQRLIDTVIESSVTEYAISYVVLV